ncbi:hypothetical protein BGZ60DRAFT_140544 [Tricladium varicosporioides]|nr:hypothetical protein BGZ60DRAFT_140544 [Hymenoscyphus varicosporioides]
MLTTGRREAVSSDGDDDDISIHSTEASEHADQLYEADRILTEKNGKYGRSYLILWDGYPLEEATWEPRKNLPTVILSAWGERKKREATGVDQPFDMADYNTAVERAQERKAERHQRRRIKRKQLGYIVSSSEDEGGGEVAEVDEVDDIPGSARSGVDPKNLRNRLVPRSGMQSLDDSEAEWEDAVDNDPKKVQRLSALKSSAEPKRTASNRASKNQRTSSSSSSDTPLATFLQDPPIPKASTSQPNKSRQATAQKKSISKATDPSVTKRPGSSASESTNDLFSSKDTLPASRGRGAIRGRSNRNIFATRKAAKKRPTLLQTSTDPSKGSKLYGNMRIRRKAELAGRALEDGPPDLESIGGLYNPSNPSNLQNLKVSNPRKASLSASVPPKQATDATQDNFSMLEKNGSSTANNSTFQMPIEHFPTMGRVRKICFFWDSKRNCQHGSGCELLHTNEPGIPVADPPRGYVARPQVIMQEISSSNQASSGQHDPFYDSDATGRAEERSAGEHPNNKIDVICYFWFRDEHCKKGEDCQYLHTNDLSKPVAPNPQRDSQLQQQPLTVDKDYEPSLDQDFTSTSTKLIAPTRHSKVSHPLEKGEQICFFWHSKHDCSKGTRCEYLHTDDSSKPVASMPPGYHPEPDPIPKQLPPRHAQPPQNPSRESLQGNSSQYEPIQDRNISDRHETTSVHTVIKTLPTRANFDTICRFWATRPQGCKKGVDCDFLHTNDPKLAVAPPPGEFRSSLVKQHRTADICRFWLAGTCKFTSNDCFQLHNYPDSSLEARHISKDVNTTPISDRPRQLMHEQSAPKESRSSIDMATTKSRERPQKSVSFAFDEPITLVSEPRNISPDPYSNSPPRREFENSHDAHRAFPTSDHEVEPVTNPTRAKRAKLSMDDYKRKSAIKSQTGRAKLITFGMANRQAIEVDTGELGCDLDRSWGQRFNSLSSIQFDQMCMAQDFCAMIDTLVDQALWKGDFLPVTTADSHVAKTLSTIAEELQDQSSGLFSVLADFVIVTYPTRSDKIWSFLDGLEIPCDQSKESNMRYLVFEPKIQLASILVSNYKDKSANRLSSNLPHQYRKDLVLAIHKLPTSGFLPHSHKKYDGNPHNYFLLFPPAATKSLVFLTSWLRASYLGCRFFGSTSGSWDYFMKSDTTLVGAVLIHESIISEISRLPGLNQIIMRSKRGVDFWCISDSTSKYPMYLTKGESESSTLGLLTATRLFPHGSVFLLTPSFVVAEPEKALLILNWFFGKELTNGKLQSATPGTWKLVCCYNFSDYLLNLANSKAYERQKFNEANKDKDSKDAEATQKGLGFERCSLRYSLHAFFTKVERRWRQVDAINDGVDFYSSIYDENESPIIYADRCIDCDNEKALVEWFAGWSLYRLNKFRRLVAIGTGSHSQSSLQRLKQCLPQHDAWKENPGVAQTNTMSPEKQKALAIAAKLNAAHSSQASQNPPTAGKRMTASVACDVKKSLGFDAQYRELIKLEAEWNGRCKASPAQYRNI